jgi:hypothetical protein
MMGSLMEPSEGFTRNEQLVIYETSFLQVPLIRFCLQHRQAIDLVNYLETETRLVTGNIFRHAQRQKRRVFCKRPCGRGICLVVAMGFSILCRPASAQGPEESSAASTTNTTPVPTDLDPSNPPSYPNADPQGASNTPNDCDIAQLKACMKDFLGDQAGIWTSPLRLRPQDALWLVPLAGATAVSFHYDVETLQQVSKSPNRIRISNDLSNAGLYGAIGIAGTTYMIGKFKHNETARKTGIIALEAMADSGVVAEVLKLVTNRERPYSGTGQGISGLMVQRSIPFQGHFRPGTRQSSGHSRM